MRQVICDFCGMVEEVGNLFLIQRPTKVTYAETLTFDLCKTCEDIVVPASDIFIREVKKQCQKAKAERESRDF